MTIAMGTNTGAGQAALEFCTALGEGGWRVVVACGPASSGEGTAHSLADALRARGTTVYELDRLVAPTWPVWRRVVSIARDVRPAAVVGIMQRDRVVALALSKYLGIPGIISAQNQHVFWGAWPLGFGKRLLYRYAVCRWASLVVCTSEPVRQEIRRFGVADERSVVLPNGIPIRERVRLTDDERRSIRSEFRAGPTDLLLVNVGRLDVQKGQDILIDAFSSVARTRPAVRLALIGDVSGGPNHARMAAFADALRRRVDMLSLSRQVTLAGWRTDVPRVLAAADGYVHSSRWEGFSLAMLEGMAAGLPVAITDCSGLPEGFVEGQHGWVVRKGDAIALARVMGVLADLSEKSRWEIGEAARTLVVKHYDVRLIARRFAELIDRVIASSSEGSRE